MPFTPTRDYTADEARNQLRDRGLNMPPEEKAYFTNVAGGMDAPKGPMPMTVNPFGSAARPGGPTSITGALDRPDETLVECHVPKAFTLTLQDHSQVPVPAGRVRIPEHFLKPDMHFYLRANGVTLADDNDPRIHAAPISMAPGGDSNVFPGGSVQDAIVSARMVLGVDPTLVPGGGVAVPSDVGAGGRGLPLTTSERDALNEPSGSATVVSGSASPVVSSGSSTGSGSATGSSTTGSGSTVSSGGSSVKTKD